MGDVRELGKALLLLGVGAAIVGALLLALGRVPFMGRLPGDITIRRGGLTCSIPVVSSIVLSLLLTLVLNVVLRVLSR